MATRNGKKEKAAKRIFTSDHARRRLKTTTFLQNCRKCATDCRSRSFRMKLNSVMSCFLAKYFKRWYVRICPPENKGYGRYGVIIRMVTQQPLCSNRE